MAKRFRKPKTKEQKANDRVRANKKYHETLKFDPEYMARITTNSRKWQLANLEKYMCGRCRQTAKKKNILFTLKPSDIKIPEMCPILNEPLIIGTRYAPSVDQIIPNKGYTKDNIWVISMKANAMKSDATTEELKLFAKWVNEYID